MILDDTILALSSPQAAGGTGAGVRAIVRLSGPDAWTLAGGIFDGSCDAAGWRPGRIAAGGVKVQGAALLFRGPRSFTGQDVAELHMPQSPALAAMLLEALVAAGARMAEPGEFTARAFFNGKMDLTEAEGIAATIAAGDAAQLRAAASLRQGDLHRWIAGLADELGNLLALVEAGIDFSDEEGIGFVSARQLAAALARMSGEIDAQLAAAVRIDRLALPPTVAFIGKPNVGKSALINALSGTQRSLVSPAAGTTRDMLAAMMPGPRGDIRLLDAPGEETPADELRQKMMAARAPALLDADLVVEVLADPAAQPAADTGSAQVTIWNKADLFGSRPGVEKWRTVSALTGLHIAELRAALAQRVMRELPAGASRLVLNQRHRGLLAQARQRLAAARELGETAPGRVELLAADLRQALDVLGQMTGTISPDEVLGRIFSQFCIGK